MKIYYNEIKLSELKKLCKARKISRYSNLKKEDLIKALVEDDRDRELVATNVIEAQENGKRMNMIRRGLATHIDGCPISARIYKGKSYANFIDDCLDCEYLLALSENMGNFDHPDQFIICGGEDNRIASEGMGQSLRIPFDRKAFWNMLNKNKTCEEEIKFCVNCLWLGNVDKSCSACPICDEDMVSVISYEELDEILKSMS